ncbi:hypothetical protein QN219_31035 [Sinorhizobium sp. 7-81]|uniref:hypothetical protein n=1 Tax=Sinorhizobium sp. 8-89 TaxID=3049089 RepID=UPI0024C289ED|nr:hypothetical protein [Sinorhizobium sp. 8-89]MDK1494387.1 hypothetical protein [Sinorhizobium sp. 8-89]
MNEANANRTVIDLGRSIAHACIRDRPEQEITFPFSLTLAIYSANRATPRLTVYDQFKAVNLSSRESSYWYKMNSEEVVGAAVGGDARPEFRRAFVYAESLNFYLIRAWIGAHEATLSDSEAPPSFIPIRLVPQPFTAENHALLSRPYGLLNMPRITNVERVSGHPGVCALEAVNTVEQQGAAVGTTEEHRIFSFDYGVLMAGRAVIALQDNALMLQLAAICFGLAFYADHGLVPGSISKATPENAASILAIATVLLEFGRTLGKSTDGYVQNSVGLSPGIYFAVAGIVALVIFMLNLPAVRMT